MGLFFLAAFVLVIAGYWRRGALVLGIGVAVAAALRLALTDDRAGLLVVRSKGTDFVTTATVSAAVLLHRRDDRPVGHQLAPRSTFWRVLLALFRPNVSLGVRRASRGCTP